MKHKTNRRTMLLATGAAAMIMTTQAAATDIPEIRGAIEFEEAKEIPKGQIKIQLEDTADRENAQNRAAEIEISSNGKAATIKFALPLPKNSKISPTLRIVARLERADGWLLARGSAKIKSGEPTNVILNTVMY